MDKSEFKWDENDNRLNLERYSLSFEDAKEVFNDKQALLITDPDYPNQKGHYVVLGYCSNLKIYVVCQFLKESNGLYRITAARKAAKSELKWYETEMR